MTEIKTAAISKAKIYLEAHIIEGATLYFVTSSKGDEFGQRRDKHGANDLFNEVVSYVRANPTKGDFYANGRI